MVQGRGVNRVLEECKSKMHWLGEECQSEPDRESVVTLEGRDFSVLTAEESHSGERSLWDLFS